jgi:hypothetical protein
MPNCIYCGKPAGLFRRYHAECRAQFDRATTTIPVFFEKLLESTLPAERFEQLLKEVAGTFHIGTEQLRALSIQGVNAMVQASLSQHLMTVEEEDRILEIAEALGFSIEDIPGLEDKLIKISTLRDLEDERTPNRVKVVGDMPFKLDRGEKVVWIFNNIKNYRHPKSKEPAAATEVPAPLQREMSSYLSPTSLGERPLDTKGLVERTVGDLMITNRNVIGIVSNEHYRKFPLAEIGAFHTYANGFQIVRKPAEAGTLSVVVDDPWFAANLIVSLLRASPHAGPTFEATRPETHDRAN